MKKMFDCITDGKRLKEREYELGFEFRVHFDDSDTGYGYRVQLWWEEGWRTLDMRTNSLVRYTGWVAYKFFVGADGSESSPEYEPIPHKTEEEMLEHWRAMGAVGLWICSQISFRPPFV